MADLSSKNALITGASGGLGQALARGLHAAGSRVVLTGTRRPALETLQAELGEGAFVVTSDLADPESAPRLVREAEDALGGGVDILLNNAGLTRDGLALRLKDEDWQTVLDVNLSAPFRLCRAVLKGMMGRRWGRIINITSVVGVTGNAGQSNYAAAKAGLIGMTKSLAQEMGPRGITVNALAPGFIVTPMTDRLPEDRRQALLKAIPVGTFGTPEDIASAAVFLASSAARYITGQTLHVNGGMAMV